MLHKIRQEIASYSPSEKKFFLIAIGCSFLIALDYSVIKPTSNSIFISHYSVHAFPYAWLISVPLNLCVVSLYNRLLPRIGPLTMFAIILLVTVNLHLLAANYITRYPLLSFALHLWKDIYVLMMFQQLWSIVHSVTTVSRAKYLYGILFGFGGIGSITGSMIPGFFALKMGSESLLWMTLPVHSLLLCAYYGLVRTSRLFQKGFKEAARPTLFSGFSLVFRSRSLSFILIIVVLMQVSTTIADFQFHTLLADRMPEQDLRTQFSGRIWGVVDFLNLCTHFTISFFLLRFFGIKNSHFFVPSILLINSALCLLHFRLSTVAYSFSTNKVLDYSIFNVTKEILYIPLEKQAKFQAKSIIDVFAYRTSKACASLFIIGMGMLCKQSICYYLSWVPLSLCLVWLGVTYVVTKDLSVPSEVSPQ